MPFIKKGTGAPKPKKKSKVTYVSSLGQPKQESPSPSMNPSYKVMILSHH